MSDHKTILRTNKTLGMKLLVTVPATLADCVAAYGEENTYNAVILHGLYNKWNPVFKKAFVEALEKETSVKVRQLVVNGEPVTKKNGRGEELPVLEKDTTYVQHLLDTGVITIADFEALAQSVADSIPLDIEINTSGDKPEPEFLAAARQKLATFEAGEDSYETFVARFAEKYPEMDVEALGGQTEVGIARALKYHTEKVLAAAPAL